MPAAAASSSVQSGTATLRWTIQESVDPKLCAHYGAVQVSTEIYDSKGNEQITTSSPCTAFSTTVELPEGWWAATLQVVDAQGHPVSFNLSTSFAVAASSNVVVESDFAAMSFP